jgi:hypothetical protein
MSMKAKLLVIVGALIMISAVTGSALYCAYPVQVSALAGLTRNYLISWSAPPGTITTESNAAYNAGPLRRRFDRARVSNQINLSGKMPNPRQWKP